MIFMSYIRPGRCASLDSMNNLSDIHCTLKKSLGQEIMLVFVLGYHIVRSYNVDSYSSLFVPIKSYILHTT